MHNPFSAVANSDYCGVIFSIQLVIFANVFFI